MQTRRTFLARAACAALCVPAAQAGLSGMAHAAAPARVVATTGMIADAARRIGGDAVDITLLMGAGIDPHSYRQTRSDIVALMRSDLVLWHGLYLEAQMETFLRGLGSRKPVTAVAETLPKDMLLDSLDYAERFDPHVWMDPRLWSRVVPSVAEALIALRPAAAPAIRDNLAAYQAEISALADYAEAQLTRIPAQQRILLTAHDAFGYFGRAYGFEVIGIQGISTESEAGLHRIRELVDLLVTRKLGAVFVESSVSDRNIRALIEGARARGHSVRIGGELFSDAMGAEGTYEGSYVGMIDHNVTTIAGALGVDVPARGMSGKLAAGI